MARTRPHFEHHVRESIRARRRFGIWTAGLIMILAVVVGLQRHSSMAAQAVTVSGRVVNISTGVGIPNAQIKVCGGGIAISSSGGYWSYPGIPIGSNYCVQYLGGAPKTVNGPYAVNNNPTVGAKAGYLNQVAGEDCFKNPKCSADEQKWDLGSDSGFDFAFINKAGITGTGSSGLSVGADVLGASKSPNVALAASANGPTPPGNFQATVGSDNAVVTLTWSPTQAQNGLKAYTIQRSLDDATWQTLSTTISGDSYTDKTAEFGVTYYYQLAAQDQAGNFSGWAQTNAQTPGFVNNNNASSGGNTSTTFTSDDGLVSVTVPPGAVQENADCSVTSISLGAEDQKPSQPGLTLILGPYESVCKDQTGQQVSNLTQAVTWTFAVSGRLGHLIKPQVYSYSSNGSVSPLAGQSYSASAGTLTVSDSTPDDELVVMASAPPALVSTNLVLALVILGLIIFGLALLILRQQQKLSYEDYLRKKYFNL